MDKFNQLCVMHGAILGDSSVEDFEQLFLEKFGSRVKFAEAVITNPNPGETLEQSGGRSDLLFWIHDDDMTKFAVPRLSVGIRWWEDVVKYNNKSYLYSKEILEKYPCKW